MHVLIEGSKKDESSVLLTLREGIGAEEVRRLLDHDSEKALAKLVSLSRRLKRLSPAKSRKHRPTARFIIADGYTLENLA